MRFFPGIVALFVTLLVFGLCTGVVHAEGQQYRLVTNYGVQQTPGYQDSGSNMPFTAVGNIKADGFVKAVRDAANAGARDGIARGVTVKVKPVGLGRVEQGIDDLRQILVEVENRLNDGNSIASRDHERQSAALDRIESKLDNRKDGSFPWWGWLLLGISGLALVVAVLNRGRDGRDGQNGLCRDEVGRMIAYAIDDHEDKHVDEDPLSADDPADALINIAVAPVGDGGTVTIGDVNITTKGGEGLPANAVNVTVAKGGSGSSITIGEIVVKTQKSSDTPSAAPAN